MATITPFRYPGAKNKLLPIIMDNLSPLLHNDGEFADVFVGGGSVLLEVAEKYPNIKLYANDKDYWVYSFWKIVSGGDQVAFEELLDLVAQKPTLNLFYALREDKYQDIVRCAYKAIFFNRTTFSGIFYSGPIGGKKQNSKYSVDCRYNPKSLRAKIIRCRELLKGRLVIKNQDFRNFLGTIDVSVPMYLDPPYYLKGDSLYIEKMDEYDHFDLSVLLFNSSDWVLSYDDCPEVRELYQDHNILNLEARYCITGTKNSWKDKGELIILP